jgi:asparagine synthase (glutamine-hydrolysing)
MCGICGVIQIGGQPRGVIDPEVIELMSELMAHRGPDDHGTHIAPGVALAARRLSIVDVEGGHQPFANEDGSVWAVQNGELYNHGDLRRTLAAEGHVFASRCDTEVLPHLYERYGRALPIHLRGKFAIAVWNGRKRRGLLARDRLGVKPLYYGRSGDLLVFASELKSVLASGLIEPRLDLGAISAYLRLGYVPAPRTPLLGIEKLLPGHSVVIEDGVMTTTCYWRYPVPAPDPRPRRDDEYADGLLERLDEAVQLRLMSDVPLGAMLSGGLDSSLVVALMARRLDEPVRTFSVGFADSPVNELPHAQAVAEALGTEHYALELSLKDQAVDLEDLVWHLDEPLADLSALGFRALSELASEHVTVALCGQGADELLGGYSRYVSASLAGTVGRLPGPLRALARAALGAGTTRTRRLAASVPSGDQLAGLLDARTVGDDAILARLEREPLRREEHALLSDVRDRFQNLPSHPLDAMLFVDGQLGLVDDMLHYFDRVSMAHSLEVRVPFLDHHVVEYAATIPRSLKVSRRMTKVLLRRIARGLVPDQIIDRPKVGFFDAAVEEWFRAQVEGGLDDYLLRGDASCLELLDAAELRNLVQAYRAGGNRRRLAPFMLRVLMLELWLSSYLPRATRAAAASRSVGPRS